MSTWGGVINMLDVYTLSPEYGDPLKMPADLMGLFEKLSIAHCGKEGKRNAAQWPLLWTDQLLTKPS